LAGGVSNKKQSSVWKKKKRLCERGRSVEPFGGISRNMPRENREVGMGKRLEMSKRRIRAAQKRVREEGRHEHAKSGLRFGGWAGVKGKRAREQKRAVYVRGGD